MILPETLHESLAPVLAACPPEGAFPTLVVSGSPHPARRLVQQALAAPGLHGRRDLAAALYLLVDDCHAAHEAVNADPTPTGSWWHAILHRREGDFGNARYWYAQIAHHPALAQVNLSGGPAAAGSEDGAFDPQAFVDHVERHLRDPHPPADLVSFQRKEWMTLFRWCCENG